MANRTDPSIVNAHNMNPQFLIDKIIRMKIWGCVYWKEHCFGLNSETLVDKALELKYVGGTYGGHGKPTKFLCLVLKMLQIQPDKAIILEFLKAKEYKYVVALAMFYLRLMGKAEEMYQCIEPFYIDHRKIIKRKLDGRFELIHMDEFANELLHSEIFLNVTLPRIPKRNILEDNGILEPRISPLEEYLNEEEESAIKEEEQIPEKSDQAKIEKNSDSSQKKKERKKKKHKHRKNSSSSRSRSRDHHNRKYKNWRSVVKKKEDDRKVDRRRESASRSKSPVASRGGKNEEFSVDYWNKIRADLGMKLLPS